MYMIFRKAIKQAPPPSKMAEAPESDYTYCFQLFDQGAEPLLASKNASPPRPAPPSPVVRPRASCCPGLSNRCRARTFSVDSQILAPVARVIRARSVRLLSQRHGHGC